MTSAIEMRDVLVAIVKGVINRERPKPRIAEVYSISRGIRRADVLLPGETEPQLQVSFPRNLQPTRSKIDDGIGEAQGDIVLIEGGVNNYRITQILSGDAMASGLWLPDQRAQANLTGGGVVDWGGRYLKWGTEFISYVGMPGVVPNGQYAIPMPASGVEIQVHGVTGVTVDTVDASGIDMNPTNLLVNSGLYWEPTLDVPYGQPGVFHLVGQDSFYPVPPTWIMIALMDLRGEGVISLKLGTGDLQDHWRAPSFANGWSNYGADWETVAYRMEPGNRVQFRGLANSGSISANICTVPEGYWPKARHLFMCMGSSKVTNGASAGTAHTHTITNGPIRVEAFPTGAIAQQDTGGTSSYISLNSISYDAATQ